MKAGALICCIAGLTACDTEKQGGAPTFASAETSVREARTSGTYIDGIGEVPAIADDRDGELWRRFVREAGWTGQGNMIHCHLEIDVSATSSKELAEIIADFLSDPYKGQTETGAPGHLRVRDSGAYALAELTHLSFLVSPFELPYERDLKIRKLLADYRENPGPGNGDTSAGEIK